LGPAIGKLKLQEYIVFSISMGSPFGKVLSGKQKGDKVQFRGKPIVIETVF
jgi:hypothetical protein